MARARGQKLKILYILDILKRYSDEENPLTAKEICSHLAEEGIEAERKSVYADMAKKNTMYISASPMFYMEQVTAKMN